MMSVEALLNNLLEQFSIPEKFKELGKLEKHFDRKERFPRIRRKRKGRPYQVPLKWKLYLNPYLCNEDSRMERDEYFIYEEGTYKKFRQLIMIRNEFVHTRMVDRGIDIHITPESQTAQQEQLRTIVANPEFSDCCKEMGIDQDPVCFKIDNARVCGTAMREIVLELNDFLGGRVLTKDFWESDRIDSI